MILLWEIGPALTYSTVIVPFSSFIRVESEKRTNLGVRKNRREEFNIIDDCGGKINYTINITSCRQLLDY